ncbi:MAG: hypothetical protein JKY60_08740 [Kordiimonadaceae bacterium]|nr:hypothetical protein [Kordiimonadaceae bacterium]
MTKHEKTAWIMTLGSALIAFYLGSYLPGLITVSDGIITSHAGLEYVCLKVIIISAIVEIIAGYVAKRNKGAVEIDERDVLIKYKASHFSLLFLTVGLVGAISMALITQAVLVSALDITVMFAVMLLLLNATWVVRHGTEIVLYRIGG